MYFMKFFFFSLYLISILAAICPNKCNSNGRCTRSGDCECNPGFEGYDCRYSHKFSDSPLEECSSNGICDRDSGTCKCFDGYGGAICENTVCPNDCSFHGVCVSSSLTTYVEDSNYPHYELASAINNNVPASIFVCVCDSDYTGYDCSEKKCPLGYKTNAACDAEQELKITMNIPSIADPGEKKYTYIEYTDPFGKKWYSKRIEIGANSVVAKYGNDDLSGTAGTNYPDLDLIDWSGIEAETTNPYIQQFKWCYVFVDFLYTLPPGTIDLKNTSLSYTDASGKIKKGCDKGGNNEGIHIVKGTGTATGDPAFTVTLKFGNGQTGDQSGIKLLVKDDEVDSGIVDTKNLISLTGNAKIIGDSDAVTPRICSGFGNCDKTTGKCKCYDGYEGYVCNEDPK